MRAALVVALWVAAAPAARADVWIDLAPMPDMSALEPAYQLDRYVMYPPWCDVGHWGESYSLGLGLAPHRGGSRSSQLAADATYASGHGAENGLLAVSSELSAIGSTVRGRHEGRLEMRDILGARAHPFSIGAVTIVEHGPPPALSPIWLGHGKMATVDGRADASIGLGRSADLMWQAGIDATVGGTWWEDGPFADAQRRGLGVSLGIAPHDEAIPRGAIDLVRARVELATLSRAQVATRGGLASGAADIRTIELGSGFRDLTYQVNRDFLAVLVADAGVVWLRSDTPDAPGTAATGAMVRAQIGASVKSVHGRPGEFTIRRFGLGLAREPGYTADGRTLTSDARVTALASIETPLVTASVSGGISSVTPVSGDVADTRSVLRYAGAAESFFPLGAGFELGAHASATFEPRANDPWVTTPAWAYEGTALLRWRGGDR